MSFSKNNTEIFSNNFCNLIQHKSVYGIKKNKIVQNFLLLFIIFFLSVYKGHSQEKSSKRIDSLKIEVKKIKNEKLKLPVLLELATLYLDFKIAESKSYSDEALSIIQKNKLDSQLGDYWFLKAKELLLMSETIEALKMIKKAQIYFLKYKKYNKYLDAVITESKIFLYSDELQKSKECLKSSIKKYGNSKFQLEIANIYVMLGVCESSDNKLINSIACLEKALSIQKKINNKKGVYDCNSMISQFYIDTQTYDKALKYAKIVKNDTSFKKNNVALASEHLTFAMIYYYSKNYSKASTEIDKCLSLVNGVGNMLLYDKISRFYVKINAQLKNDDKLISFCNENLKKYNESSDINFILYYGLSSSYYNKKQYILSKKYNDLMFDLFKAEEKWIIEIINNDLNLYELFAKTEYALKNYSQAYLFQKKHAEYKDEYSTKQNLLKVLELQEAFDSKQKDLELKDLTISKQNQKLEIINQKNYSSKLLILIFSVLVAFSLALIGFFNNKKKNKQLNYKNNIISEKIMVVEEQKIKLSQSVAERDLLLKDIHHRVKNNLQIVMSLLNIQAKEGVNLNINDFVEKAQSRVSLMSLIHQSLYENEKFDSINFQNYLEKLTSSLISLFGLDSTNIRFEIKSNDIYLDIQTAIPLGLILNELLSNSFKHAFSNLDNALIIIKINKVDEKSYVLYYSDNGKGYLNNEIKGKSLGLELVNLLAKQMKGKIEKQNTKATQYTMHFMEKIEKL